MTAPLLFIGDTHGHFSHVIEAVDEHRPEAIIFVGDLQPQRPLHIELAPIVERTEIWWIAGNHDTDSEADYTNLFSSALAGRNLHGRIETICGIRVAGLGGIFRDEVWTPPGAWCFETLDEFEAQGDIAWRDNQVRKHRSSIFPADYFSLVGQRADVLVTHEAPSCHPHGNAAIDEVARNLGVKTLFHGHHHDRLDYQSERDRLGFTAFGIGLHGITDLDGNVVCPGKLDDARVTRRA